MTGLATLTRDVAAGRAGDSVAAATLLLDPAAKEADVAAYLTAKAQAGATAEDVEALVRAVLSAAVRVPYEGRACDLVGTGGDGSGSVNISTLAAMLAVASGATVAKAGNRAATSRCGSADLLESLEVPVDPGPQAIAETLRDSGFAFVLTSAVNPAVARLAALRRRLGFPTLFNLSGPLSNPVSSGARIIGVTRERDQEIMAEAASGLGMSSTWLVRAKDGMDELSTRVPAKVIAVGGDASETFTLDPADLGVRSALPEELAGGGPEINTAIARAVLRGTAAPGLIETCALNAAALLAAELTATDWGSEIVRQLDRVRDAVTDGAAAQLLADLTTDRGRTKRRVNADVSG